MMSSTTASKLPVRAASRPARPSARATTSMPSAVSPRANAVRMPGSSSTTSTRATCRTLPLRRFGPAAPFDRGATVIPSTSSVRTLSALIGHAVAMATVRTIAASIAVAGLAGLGVLATPLGAEAQPELPPVGPEELVSSVLTAAPGEFAGTIEVDNALRLPAFPDMPQTADGTSTGRVWSDGERRGRVQLPTADGERTLVSDGETFWSWNSADRTVRRAPEREGHGEAGTVEPQAAAADLIRALRST